MANKAKATSAKLAAEKAKKREADAERSRQRVKKRLDGVSSEFGKKGAATKSKLTKGLKEKKLNKTDGTKTRATRAGTSRKK